MRRRARDEVLKLWKKEILGGIEEEGQFQGSTRSPKRGTCSLIPGCPDTPVMPWPG